MASTIRMLRRDHDVVRLVTLQIEQLVDFQAKVDEIVARTRETETQPAGS